MAAIINARDVLLQAATPRLIGWSLGTHVDFLGTLNGEPVQDVIDAAYASGGGDVTEEILENSGTTITVNSSVLFEMLGPGVGGTFIGGGGIFGKDPAGVTKFSLNSSTGLLTAEDAIISGTITVGSIIDPSVTINGTPASTVVNNADDGFTAFQDTIDFRVPGSPTNLPVISTITTSPAAVGTVDIKLTWTYTQGAIKADHFILYYLEGTTNPTTSSPVLAVVDGDSRDLTISGVPMDKSYKIGIVAARNSSFGIQKTAIVNAWTRTGSTANITANIDGTPPSGVKNSGITLSSSGTLLGAGGGSISALDYSNVVNGPPITATSNFFSTSINDPAGGVDGDAHFNSSTNVMWFRIGGVWRRGGTINANEITVGTLAAARIQANSITSDKISVSTLSAITANLGTVTAGSITGSAGIDITGIGRFRGNDGSYSLHANYNGLTSSCGGLNARSTSSFIPAVRAECTTSGGTSIQAVSNSSSITALVCINASGIALDITGRMAISNTTLVSNLNADMVDGNHSTAFCKTVGSHGGTATVSSSHFNILTTVGGYTTTGGGSNITFAPSSDERLKFDIEPEQLGLDFICSLNPVTFRRYDRSSRILYHGFVAQHVGKLLNQEDDCLFLKNEDGYYGTDYAALTSPMALAIKQLNDKIKVLEQMIENLK